MGNRRSQTGIGSRRRRRGQAMVEFALVAPLFLGILFSIAEAGLLLYVFNSAQHAITVGAQTVAAEGSQATSDSDAIAQIRATDFGGSGLVTITEYDFYLLASNGANTRDTSSCVDSGGAPAGCFQTYRGDGTLVAGNWLASARHTGMTTADYAELDLHYDYHYFFSAASVIHLQTRRFFRLEPQS